MMSEDVMDADDFALGLRTSLHRAAFEGHVMQLRQLIQQGTIVNCPTIDGVTPLHEACSQGHMACVVMLLEAGAQVNAMNVDSSTPLCDAASFGNVDCVRLLLRSGAVTNPPTMFTTPLHEAALRGHVTCLKELVSAGGNVDATDGHFGTPLHAACHQGRVQCAKVLLKAGANVNALKIHETPLHVAASTGNLELTQLLLDFGADVNYWDNRGRRPTDRAVKGGVVADVLQHHAGEGLRRVRVNVGFDLTQVSKQLHTSEAKVWNSQLLCAFSENVAPLTQLCRLVIVKSLRGKLLGSVHTLGLPKSVQEYLCFSSR